MPPLRVNQDARSTTTTTTLPTRGGPPTHVHQGTSAIPICRLISEVSELLCELLSLVVEFPSHRDVTLCRQTSRGPAMRGSVERFPADAHPDPKEVSP